MVPVSNNLWRGCDLWLIPAMKGNQWSCWCMRCELGWFGDHNTPSVIYHSVLLKEGMRSCQRRAMYDITRTGTLWSDLNLNGSEGVYSLTAYRRTGKHLERRHYSMEKSQCS
jgi:hypothetical protein